VAELATTPTAAPVRAVSGVDPGWNAPSFSLAERDRRWSRVRELMADHGVDCLVASACTGIQGRAHADVKYLTQLGTNDEQFGVVFPITGTPSVAGWPGRRPADEWIDDRRDLSGGFLSPAAWGRTMAELLLEKDMARATVAVCGLGCGGPEQFTQIRQSDGYIPHTTMQAMREALPDATFVDANPIIGRARYVKSDEEIEVIRQGVAIAERALYAMVASAHTGAFEPRVYAEMLAAELAVGGTLPTMISWASGPSGEPMARLEQPVPRHLRSGDLVSVEIEGRWAGYNGQVDSTMTVGDVPTWVRDSHRVAFDALQATIDAITPGVRFGQLRKVSRSVVNRGDFEVRLIMHGRGLGDDGPLIGVDGPVDDMAVEEGTCFSVKPAVLHQGRYCARIGESVVVRGSGARRLGTRPLDHAWAVD
jgi:Xaa-Pro aminopeptidase